jgi:murein DD-endopeptidase MepM/ murein hydrolase activator NlpD
MYKFLISIFWLLPMSVFAASVTVRQGDVAFVEIKGHCYKTSILVPKVGAVPIFNFQNKKLIAVPVDIRSATGTLMIPSCGLFTKTKLQVVERIKEKKVFIIPESKGGNTTLNANKIKKEVQSDSQVFQSVHSSKKQMWSKSFIFPVEHPFMSDTYGYVRDSQGVDILHKGVDFVANIGTPVHAMNVGVVRYIGTLPAYGKSIIIDHGSGIQTIYLHLSKIVVAKGVMVKQGQIIGDSGDTGFVTGPHLHLSIRVSGVSIDPESFMRTLGSQ